MSEAQKRKRAMIRVAPDKFLFTMMMCFSILK